MRCARLNGCQSSHGHTQLGCLDTFVVIGWVPAETERSDKFKVQCGCLRVQQTRALLRGP